MSGLTPGQSAAIEQDYTAARHEVADFFTHAAAVTEDGSTDAEKWVLLCSEIWEAVAFIPDGDPRARQFIIRLAAAAIMRTEVTT